MSRKKIESQTIGGQHLRDLRISKNMRQDELAAKSGIGITSLRLYESGKRVITHSAAQKLSAALECPIIYFLNDASLTMDSSKEKEPPTAANQDNRSSDGFWQEFGFRVSEDFDYDTYGSLLDYGGDFTQYETMCKHYLIENKKNGKRYRISEDKLAAMKTDIIKFSKTIICQHLEDVPPEN